MSKSFSLVTAYSTNAHLDKKAPVEVEYDPICPKNGWAMNWAWYEIFRAPKGALGSAKIRGGYDYREPYMRPSMVLPHSICPGDCFQEDLEDE